MAKKGKAQDLPGVEGPGVSRPKVAAIEKAAEEYVALRDSRMETLKEEVKAKQKLADLMHKNELINYPLDDGSTVVVEPGEEKVKVKRAKQIGEDDED